MKILQNTETTYFKLPKLINKFFFSTKHSLEMLKFLAPRGMCCLHPQSSSRGGKHFFWQKWFSDKKKDKTYKRQNLMKERIISLYSIFEVRKHLLTSRKVVRLHGCIYGELFSKYCTYSIFSWIPNSNQYSKMKGKRAVASIHL